MSGRRSAGAGTAAGGGRPARAAVEDAGLVLRRFRYGESSLVAHVLTREHGRVALFAKGAYRRASGFCGVLDLFDTLRLAWRPAQGAELAVLRAGSIERRRKHVARSLPRYRAGLSVLEVAGLGARSGVAERTLVARVEAALDDLDRGLADPGTVRAAFELRFLADLGLSPSLGRCASCGREPAPEGSAERVPFAVAAGGRLCEPCAAGAASGSGIERVPLKWMSFARSLMEAHVPLERFHVGFLPAFQGFVERFLEHHLEARPRSWSAAGRPSPAAPHRSGPRR